MVTRKVLNVTFTLPVILMVILATYKVIARLYKVNIRNLLYSLICCHYPLPFNSFILYLMYFCHQIKVFCQISLMALPTNLVSFNVLRGRNI